MKKITIIMVLLAISFVIGCSGTSNNQTNGKENVNSGEKAQKTYKLKLAHYTSPKGFYGSAIEKWAKEVEKATNNRVQIEIFGGAVLGGSNQQYDLLKSGAADISWGFVGLFPNEFPITQAVGLPMLGIKSGKQGSGIFWKLYNESPALQKEYETVKVLALHTHGPAPIEFGKKKLETLESLKRQQIRSPGGGPAELLKQSGAVPVVIPPTDIYTSLEKGILDGYSLAWEGIDSYKLDEVTKYVLDAKLFTGPFWILMNKKVWDSLPKDIQDAIDSVSGEKASILMGGAADEGEAAVRETLKKKGIEMYPIPSKDLPNWTSLAEGINKKWVEEMNKKGLAGQEVYDQLLKIIKEAK